MPRALEMLDATLRRIEQGEIDGIEAIDDPTISVRRTGSKWSHLQTRRSADALLSVRGCQRAHQCGSSHIAAEKLGDARRPRSLWPASSLSSCTASGPTAQSSTGIGQLYEPLTSHENRFGGTSVPAGTMVAAISKFVLAGIAPRSSH